MKKYTTNTPGPIPQSTKKQSPRSPLDVPLFDMETIAVVSTKTKPTRWYYITRRRNTEMLHYISSFDGSAVWCEHDTRNVQPMLFNSAHTAKLSMRKHGGTDVKRWYWRVENRGTR
jgi:hypothetical protein